MFHLLSPSSLRRNSFCLHSSTSLAPHRVPRASASAGSGGPSSPHTWRVDPSDARAPNWAPSAPSCAPRGAPWGAELGVLVVGSVEHGDPPEFQRPTRPFKVLGWGANRCGSWESGFVCICFQKSQTFIVDVLVLQCVY